MTDLIRLFTDHLRVDKGLSPHTLVAYTRDLNQLQDSLKKDFIQASEADIQNFLKELKKREQKSTSVARKISALKQFYKFLVLENLIVEDPTLFIEAPLHAKKLPKALDSQSIIALLRVVDEGLPYEGNYSPQIGLALKLRDRAMIYLLYATGVRVSELIGIPLSRVDIEAGYIKVLGKRSKERIVPFAPVAGEILYSYLNEARPLFQPQEDLLFVGMNGEGLTRQGFWKTLKKLALQAGIPQNLHPHILRHTFATELLKAGIDLRSLQMLLGHSDLQTTQIYTHIAPEKLAEVIRKFHPRG